jgi:hypothetical protein
MKEEITYCAISIEVCKDLRCPVPYDSTEFGIEGGHAFILS